MDQCKWQQLEAGLEVCELNYQSHGWDAPQRLVVVRKNGAVAGKTLSLFADDANLQGWCYVSAQRTQVDQNPAAVVGS
jgi:hypothetical protein